MGRRVVVVGAGISGLSAAHALGEALPASVEVLVLEGSSQLGGKLRVEQVAGLACDVGAEALLNRRPEAVALARAVGLADDLVHPVSTGAAIWTRGAVRSMPRTVMGVPADLDSLATSGIVSGAGLARARIEPGLAGTGIDPDSADTVSVGSVVDRRFGPEVTDRLVEPLLGGVYAGHARDLSLAAAAPAIARLAAADRSLLQAAQRAESAGTAPEVPVFAGVRGGVGRLPQAVADASRATLRLRAPVRELDRLPGGRWRLVVGSASDPERLEADAVVLATPAAATARLLRDVAPDAASALRRIEYASMAVVSLAYPSAAVGDRLRGSGFLVPPVDGRAVKAATFSANKWAWLGERARRASVTVLRASVGRHRDEQLLQRDDAELVELAAHDLAEAVGLSGPVVDARVTRWGGALPQYALGHAGRVTRVRGAVDRVAHLQVCGAAYDGLGVAACVADGQRAATRVVAGLERAGRMDP